MPPDNLPELTQPESVPTQPQQSPDLQQPKTDPEAHKASVAAQLSPMGKRLFKYIEFDEDEVLIAEIRKHPLGLFFIGVTGSFIALIVSLAATLLAVNLDKFGVDLGDKAGIAKAAIIFLGLGVALLSIIMTVILAFIYRSNVVFVTSDKISEVLYRSIFNRQVTQLGIGSVEDVNVIQKGILPRIFDYGALLVETAGELKNPNFTFVPKPSLNSQLIIKAHEDFVKKYGN